MVYIISNMETPLMQKLKHVAFSRILFNWVMKEISVILHRNFTGIDEKAL